MRERYIKFFEDEDYISHNPDLSYLIKIHNDVYSFKRKNEDKLNYSRYHQQYVVKQLRDFYKNTKTRYKYVLKNYNPFLHINFERDIENNLMIAKEFLNNLENGYNPNAAEQVIMELHDVIRHLIEIEKNGKI
jgi:hypothetical protein